MGPIPNNFDINEIIKDQLCQIGVGQWDVQFHFGNGCVIQSQGKVDVLINGEKHTIFDGEWENIGPVAGLVGLDVGSWSKLSSHSFEVKLKDGPTIVFYSTDSQYEEVVIHPKTKEVVWVF